MKNSFVIARKDLASYFHSWVGVLVFVFFFLLAGIFFSIVVARYSEISLEATKNTALSVEGIGLTRYVFGSLFLNLSMLLIFLVPLMTMKSFAEERKLQTLELLFTYPLSDFEIVWGKFMALVWFFELLFLPTAGYLLLIRWLGGSFDWGPVLTAYFGFWLLGNAYLSLGLFVSSLTENEVASAIVTFSAFVIFWIFDWVATVTEAPWSQIFTALSPLTHYREFTVGVLDLSHVVYFLFFHLYFLFLTLRSIETRNWKG